MRESTSTGANKTGSHVSLFDYSSVQMPPSTVPSAPGDASAVRELRREYIVEADVLGSVPMAGTTGAGGAGISISTGNSPEIFLDKLGERLAFERTATRLYDALISKFEAVEDEITSMAIGDLRHIRSNEARHITVLADAIEMLGGDPTAQTPSADLAGVESMGLVQVLTDPRTSLAQSLHAMLAAELIDQSGWELLIALAKGHQHNALISEFSVALDEERSHLRQVRSWYEEAILGVSHAQGTLIRM